jgi:hypothetical protein
MLDSSQVRSHRKAKIGLTSAIATSVNTSMVTQPIESPNPVALFDIRVEVQRLRHPQLERR